MTFLTGLSQKCSRCAARVPYQAASRILPVVTVIGLAACGGDRQSSNQSGPQALPIQVAQPEVREVKLTQVYTGRFVPVEEVELRGRVSGYVESVHFEEGQKVTEGDLMFQIDPRPFDAALDAATAEVQQAQARLELARSNQKRAEKLLNSNAISGEEADIRRSETLQAQADLAAAQAAERKAELQREYADVRAPISGIASEYFVTPGNFITGGTPGSTMLTTIVPHDPIHAEFEVDERQVLAFTRQFFEGKRGGREGKRPQVEVAVSDRDEFEFQGIIDFADNQLDRSTATNRLRALVKNENEFLTPGLFARVRISIGDPFQATLVPDAALGFDQDKRFAWVVGPENKVSRRFVEVGELQGAQRIIESGLAPDDIIAISNIQLLREGTAVDPQTTGQTTRPDLTTPESPPPAEVAQEAVDQEGAGE